MKGFCMLAAFVVMLPLSPRAQDATVKSPFAPIQFFAGRWHGTTHGEPGNGRGERNYGFVLRGKFLRVTNRTVYPAQEKNPKGEVHEDVGYFSYDRAQKRIVLRQFHVEGFVNEYVQKGEDDNALVFETEVIENIPEGWKARESYKVVSPDEFVEVFELAEPHKEFAVYSQSRWRRVK